MQCFWTPYICIFAACAIADTDIWSSIVDKLHSLNKPADTKEESEDTASEPSGGRRHSTMSAGVQSLPRANSVIVSLIRNVMVILVIVFIAQSQKEGINKELEDLREFWDPDTVDLMEWIVKETPKNAAFTGSMQLLAGVRLCTWRPITNHPHFEDKALRDRTREVIMCGCTDVTDELRYLKIVIA